MAADEGSKSETPAENEPEDVPEPKPRTAPSAREPRRGSEPRRSLNPPALLPVRASPPSSISVRDSARHLSDLQRELERKTRFLVRIGVIPQR